MKAEEWDRICPHNPVDEVNPHGSQWLSLCLDCLNAERTLAQQEARAERDRQWAEALGQSGARVPCGCEKCAPLRALLEETKAFAPAAQPSCCCIKTSNGVIDEFVPECPVHVAESAANAEGAKALEIEAIRARAHAEGKAEGLRLAAEEALKACSIGMGGCAACDASARIRALIPTTAASKCQCGEQDMQEGWSAITDKKWKMHRRTGCYDRPRPEAATDDEWAEVAVARSATGPLPAGEERPGVEVEPHEYEHREGMVSWCWRCGEPRLHPVHTPPPTPST